MVKTFQLKRYLIEKWRDKHVSRGMLNLNTRYVLDRSRNRIIDRYKRVPNLILIGSQKCGTSSLHQYLNKHPEIYMSSPIKEPGYFIFDDWARNYWAEKGKIIESRELLRKKYMISKQLTVQKYFGESSTYYTQDTRETDFNIPSRIIDESPDARILYIIRNPLDRIISAYHHVVKYWRISESIEGLLRKDLSIIRTSQYFQRIKPYLEIFGRDRVQILQFEELVASPQSVMDDISNFLDIPTHYYSDFEVFHPTNNTPAVKLSSSLISKLKPYFIEQKQLLESELNLEISWNLSNSE